MVYEHLMSMAMEILVFRLEHLSINDWAIDIILYFVHCIEVHIKRGLMLPKAR